MNFRGFAIARIGRAIADELRARQNARALQHLDDRTLADMGIARGEIDGLVRGTSRRRG